jgi:hypothetical protein
MDLEVSAERIHGHVVLGDDQQPLWELRRLPKI